MNTDILQHHVIPMKPRDPRDPDVLPPSQDVVPSAFYAPEHPTDEQLEVLDATNGLFNLIQKYGAPRVMRWVRNLAVIAGQEV